MTTEAVCWYLCGLFAVAATLQSAMTVAPGAENAHQAVTIGTACLAVASGVAAAVLHRGERSEPAWLLRLLQAVAVLATVGVVLLIGG